MVAGARGGNGSGLAAPEVAHDGPLRGTQRRRRRHDKSAGDARPWPVARMGELGSGVVVTVEHYGMDAGGTAGPAWDRDAAGTEEGGSFGLEQGEERGRKKEGHRCAQRRESKAESCAHMQMEKGNDGLRGRSGDTPGLGRARKEEKDGADAE